MKQHHSRLAKGLRLAAMITVGVTALVLLLILPDQFKAVRKSQTFERRRQSDPFDDFRPSIDEFEPLQALPEPMRPITKFPILTVAEVEKSRAQFNRQTGDDRVAPLLDEEQVMGVVIAGEARAYPLNVLTNPNREIFNDTLGGRPIAATW